jgi:hypothetical protein
VEPGYLLEIKNLEIGWSECGNWIRLAFSWKSLMKIERFQHISRVKIKTVLLKSNIFLKVFYNNGAAASFSQGFVHGEALLTNGFKLFVRSFESFFFF